MQLKFLYETLTTPAVNKATARDAIRRFYSGVRGIYNRLGGHSICYSHLNAGISGQTPQRRPSKGVKSARNIRFLIKFSYNAHTWKHTASADRK